MSTMQTKPCVGETVWSIPIGNRARREKAEPQQHEIVRVGRKYYYIEAHSGEVPIEIETGIEGRTERPGFRCFRSLYDHAQYVERNDLTNDLCQASRQFGAFRDLSMEDLRAVHKILCGGKP